VNNAKDFRKDFFFLFTVGSVCRVKRFHHGGKCFADEEMETEVRKWLRRQLKAAVSDALVKRWDRCVSVGGGYV
jgi:hypothetical protein